MAELPHFQGEPVDDPSSARRDQTSERLYDAGSVVDMQDALEAARLRADAERRAAAWAAGAEARERQSKLNRQGAAAARAALGLPPRTEAGDRLSLAARQAVAESQERSAARQAERDEIARNAPKRSYQAPNQGSVNHEPWPEDKLDAAS